MTDHKVVSTRWGLDDLIQNTKEIATLRKLANNAACRLLATLAVVITQLLSDDIVAGSRLGEELQFNPPDYHTMSVALGELRWNLFRLDGKNPIRAARNRQPSHCARIKRRLVRARRLARARLRHAGRHQR